MSWHQNETMYICAGNISCQIILQNLLVFFLFLFYFFFSKIHLLHHWEALSVSIQVVFNFREDIRQGTVNFWKDDHVSILCLKLGAVIPKPIQIHINLVISIRDLDQYDYSNFNCS